MKTSSPSPLLLGFGVVAAAGAVYLATRPKPAAAVAGDGVGAAPAAARAIALAQGANIEAAVAKGMAHGHPINLLAHGLHEADLLKLRAAAEKAPKHHLTNAMIAQALGHGGAHVGADISLGWGFSDLANVASGGLSGLASSALGGHHPISLASGHLQSGLIKGMTLAHPIEGIDLIDIVALQGAARRNQGTLNHHQIQALLAAMNPRTESHRHAKLAQAAHAHGGTLPSAAKAALDQALAIAARRA